MAIQSAAQETSSTTLISPHAVMLNVNRVGSTGMPTRLEVHCDGSKFQIVRLPVESAFRKTGNGYQHVTAGLHAPDPLITNVSFYRRGSYTSYNELEFLLNVC